MPGIPSPFLVLNYNIDGPVAIKYAAVGLPITIATLLHYPGTRAIRLALWPLTIAAGIWVIATCKGDLPSEYAPCVPYVCAGFEPTELSAEGMRASQFILVFTFYGATKYAFAHTPPVNHPLPRQPPLGFLRQIGLAKGILLLLNSFREINTVPNPPLKPISGKYRWLRSVGTHYLNLTYHTIALDFVSYPLFLMAPETFGRPLVGGDFQAWYVAQAHSLGLPSVLVYIWWAFLHAFEVYFGMQAVYHMYALAGILLGVYLPEEFPPAMDKPWLATSIFELWGTRYHTFMKNLFIYFALPAKQFGKILHVLSCFVVSAVFHVLIYYPGHHTFPFGPFLTFYVGNGIGAVLERVYLKMTGRKVGGLVGRIWVYTWVLLCAYPMNMLMYGNGQIADFRSELSTELRPYSLAAWTAYGLGVGTRPTEPIPDFLAGLGAYSSPGKVAQRLPPPQS